MTSSNPKRTDNPDLHERTSRRSVLQTGTTAALMAGIANWLSEPLRAIADEASTPDESSATAAPLPFFDRIGLQLYTVRNQMAEDPQATLQAVAKAGYRQVELMSINREAVKLAAIARDQGMMVHSGFMDFKGITNPDADGITSVNETVEYAERIGLRHIVFGYIGRHERDTADKCKRIADAANLAAEKTRKAGMRMCYHNHSFEFKKFDDGQTGFDIFIERFDPQLMDFEMDVFWVKLGGGDPLAMMRQLAGRITQVHLKDLKANSGVITDESKVPADSFQELGDGTINMLEVMKLASEIGVRECHVEQDQSPAPLESIHQSYQFLQENKNS